MMGDHLREVCVLALHVHTRHGAGHHLNGSVGTRLVFATRTVCVVVVPVGGHEALWVAEPVSVIVHDRNSGGDTRYHRSHDSHEHSDMTFHDSLQAWGLLPFCARSPWRPRAEWSAWACHGASRCGQRRGTPLWSARRQQLPGGVDRARSVRQDVSGRPQRTTDPQRGEDLLVSRGET